jgi:hypothetical protein
MGTPQLFDIRQELWSAGFSAAKPYGEFIAGGAEAHQRRWAEYYERFSLSEAQRAILGSFTRKINVLVLAGAWCGDCARQCPMLAHIAEASPSIDLRFLDNQADAKLRDELRIHGAARVPAVVVLSEDMLEIARGVDRTLTVYRRKARTELGAACDAGIVPPAGEELAAELQEWLDIFERAHLLVRVSPFLRARHND